MQSAHPQFEVYRLLHPLCSRAGYSENLIHIQQTVDEQDGVRQAESGNLLPCAIPSYLWNHIKRHMDFIE